MADAFTRGIAKVAVAQICQTYGFAGIQRSAADALVDILIRYIRELGSACKSYAELAGRIECNLNDLLLSFSDVGASVTDVMRYVEWADEVPFPRSLPRFPIKRRQHIYAPTFAEKGEAPPRDDIPDWMPVLPEKHTYISTPIYEERVSDPRESKIEQGKERRRAERALVSLHRRLDAQGLTAAGSQDPLLRLQASRFDSEQTSVLMETIGGGGGKKGAALTGMPPNPFLVHPHAAGERERSPPLGVEPPEANAMAAMCPPATRQGVPGSAMEAFSSFIQNALKKDDCMRMDIDETGCEIREGKGFISEMGSGKEGHIQEVEGGSVLGGAGGGGGGGGGGASEGSLPVVTDRTPVLFSFHSWNDLHRKRKRVQRIGVFADAKNKGVTNAAKEEKKEKDREKERVRGAGNQGADVDEKKKRAEVILSLAETERAEKEEEGRGRSLHITLLE